MALAGVLASTGLASEAETTADVEAGALAPGNLPAPPPPEAKPILTFHLPEPPLPKLTNSAHQRLADLVEDFARTNSTHLPGQGIPDAHSTNADRALLSPNLHPPPSPDGHQSEAERLEQLETQLALARRQRHQKEFSSATKGLSAVLNAEAPTPLHQAALLELAFVAQDEGQFVRAQQVYGRYLNLYPQDPSMPEILLRQGLLYRQMGSSTLAIAKFYAVMTSALNLKLDRMEYYERLVLQAQTEIADTYLLQGRFEDAADFYQRLLKRDSTHLNKTPIHFKLVRCLAATEKRTETIAQASRFIEQFPEAAEVPEVRFLMATAYRQAGLDRDALHQVLLLLESQHNTPRQNAEAWTYWQRRAGNDLANQLYLSGDFENTLLLYEHLARLDSSAAWRIPVWYQIGLVYERLLQPQKATQVYAQILETGKSLSSTNVTPSLNSIVEMARWRQQALAFLEKAQAAQLALRASLRQEDRPDNKPPPAP